MTSLRYRVAAPAQHVVDAIAAVTSPGGPVGYTFTDRAKTELVGDIRGENFTLRRARGLATVPRVLVLRGKIESTDAGTNVTATFRLHPAVKVTQIIWLVVFLAIVAVVLPNALHETQLFWIIVVLGLVVGLMMLPFQWLARTDKPVLRRELERALLRAGPIASEDGGHRPA